VSDKILIIAGEVSGDHHAAELVKAMQQSGKAFTFHGIGGDDLQECGMELFFHVRDMAFLGIAEVLRHLPFIRRVMLTIVEWARKERPACVILVDYPGFNLRLAARLKKIGIPVVYYISPQLWAWGRGRIHKIRRDVDLMLVLFPFEQKFYADYGIEAHYVGHPLVDKHTRHLPEQVKTPQPGNVIVGLLPGSRKQEVRLLLPTMLESVRRLRNASDLDRVEIIRVEHIEESFYRSFYSSGDDEFITLKKANLRDVLRHYDAVAVASGTATLECAFYAVPMVIVYHVSLLTYWLGRMLVKVPFIGLANIVAEQQVAKELIQDDLYAAALADELHRLLQPQANREAREKLKTVRQKLGQPGASDRAAGEIIAFLKKR